MLVHKGISELVGCARELTKSRDVNFLLVGPIDPGNPASIEHNRLLEWENQGWIRFLGERTDIRELMAISDIVTLPSYREGFPRVLLEASAMGKPMVATDVPGCREVVEHGKNGTDVLKIGGQRIPLPVHRFTDWVRVQFPLAPGLKLRGICRFYLKRFDDRFEMYCTPLQIDPDKIDPLPN